MVYSADFSITQEAKNRSKVIDFVKFILLVWADLGYRNGIIFPRLVELQSRT